MEPIKVFIGYDRKETVAYQVLCHSIIKRSSVPVSITALNKDNLRGSYWRPRGEHDSTDFSNSRWIVPHLCDYKGWALFLDCDMICLGDIAELYSQRDMRFAVQVRKHNYEPKEDVKFLGQRQTKYSKKNWSSMMLFNNDKCRPLTKHIVNTMSPGLWFHQFNWLPDEDIGEIRGEWNSLVGAQEFSDSNLVHYTSGGPWHNVESEWSQAWLDEYNDMVSGDNPVKWWENAKTTIIPRG